MKSVRVGLQNFMMSNIQLSILFVWYHFGNQLFWY
uniref:Uncharacterized protein n=1 Tax=Anguilla anguilla TaxID=7936 RepID=A0A0E9UD37_ANGAN